LRVRTRLDGFIERRSRKRRGEALQPVETHRRENGTRARRVDAGGQEESERPVGDGAHADRRIEVRSHGSPWFRFQYSCSASVPVVKS